MSEPDLRHQGLMLDDYQMLKAPSILVAFLHSEAGHSMPSLETGHLFSLPPSGQRCANSDGYLGECQQCAPAVCQVMFWAALCLMPTTIRKVNFVSFVLTNKGFKDIKQLIILNRQVAKLAFETNAACLWSSTFLQSLDMFFSFLLPIESFGKIVCHFLLWIYYR